ncbi:hypothetical protein C5S36_04095, partial [Candidatus Methanophagaceae archaeon]
FSNESDVWEFKVGTGQTAPSIQLNYPDDKANLNSSTVNFNWTATDNIDDVLLCNLTIDGVVNQSNIASTSGQPTNRSVSGLSAVGSCAETGIAITSTDNSTIALSPCTHLVLFIFLASGQNISFPPFPFF